MSNKNIGRWLSLLLRTLQDQSSNRQCKGQRQKRYRTNGYFIINSFLDMFNLLRIFVINWVRYSVLNHLVSQKFGLYFKWWKSFKKCNFIALKYIYYFWCSWRYHLFQKQKFRFIKQRRLYFDYLLIVGFAGQIESKNAL